jgi:hypothetical protein
MYLDPEQLEILPTVFQQDLPIVSWGYVLTSYGRQRLDEAARYDAEDRVVGSVHAALVIGSSLFLLLVILAFATDHVWEFWQHIHWPAGLWLTGIAAACLHAWLAPQPSRRYPLVYQLQLNPGPRLHAAKDVPLVFTLRCNVEPPRGHAQPGVLSTLDKLDSFEIRRPQAKDPEQRHMLLAHFAPDATVARESHLIATWTEGELEAAKSHPPLQRLHEQLTWAFRTTSQEWLRNFRRNNRPDD